MQVGGAEVIHFKAKINDTINSCLGHCSGGQGRIFIPAAGYPGPRERACVLICTQTYTAVVHTGMLSCGSFDMSCIHLP